MNNKHIKNGIAIFLSTLLATTTILSLTSCSQTDTKTTEPQTNPVKQIEVYRVEVPNKSLVFTKSGQITASEKALIMPQIAGTITDIKVKLGDKVQKGQTLITLGNSLSTDVIDINYQSSLEALDILDTLKLKTDYAAQKDVAATLQGYYSAKAAYENAIKSRDHAEDLYDEQHKYLKDHVEYLEDAMDMLEKSPNYEDSPDYQTVEQTYKQFKSQLEQLEIGHDTQDDMTDFGLESAKRGIESALLAVEGVRAKYNLQFLQLDSSVLQATTGSQISKLQSEAKSVKSPISGYVTAISATKNNQVAPGQPLVIVENLENFKINTSINQLEAKYVKPGDTVKIGETTGVVYAISPALSDQTNKIDIEIHLTAQSSAISGEFTDITFTPGTNSIFIPLETVSIEDTKYFTKIVTQDNKIKRIEIKTGDIIENYIEVTDGLKPNDIVAIPDTVFLNEGDEVSYKLPRTL